MNVSPTRRQRSSEPQKARAKKTRLSIAKRRATPLNPEIYVRGESAFGMVEFKRAHLRNKRGYVYLCWREGDRVRNFYLGKAPRKSPTPRSDIGSSSAAPASSRSRSSGSRL
jgi:hypothetical protein